MKLRTIKTLSKGRFYGPVDDLISYKIFTSIYWLILCLSFLITIAHDVLNNPKEIIWLSIPLVYLIISCPICLYFCLCESYIDTEEE